MQYRKMRRFLAGVLMAAMLTGQTPAVLAAGAEDGEVIVSEEAGEAVSEDLIDEEETVSENGTEDEGDVTLPEDLVPGVDYAEHELCAIVDDEEEGEALAAFYGGTVRSYQYGVVVIDLGEQTVAQALKINRPDGMKEAFPNYIHHAEASEEAALYESAYAEDDVAMPSARNWEDWYDGTVSSDRLLNVSNPDYLWMHDMVRTYPVWGVTTGKKEIRVAVMGGCADASQADFAEFDGSNSRIDSGYMSGCIASDPNGDATHAAGIVAAGLQNGRDAVGIAPGVSVYGVSIMNEDGSITTDAFCAGIRKLVGDRKADIILFSSFTDGTFVKQEQDAITDARKNGITIIAGAGDYGSNSLTYPAAYDGVLSVGAVDKDGQPAPFSNFGTAVDLQAPGTGLVSTVANNAYARKSSTNTAAAVVAGVAALYMSANGHVAPDDMKEALVGGSVKGIVNAEKMFSADKTAPKIILNDGRGCPVEEVQGGKSVTIAYTVPGDDSISINAMNYSGKPGNNNVIVYCTDGTEPLMKDGVLTRGKVYNGKLSLKGMLKGDGVQKVTITAACVNGMGIMSEVSTMILKVDPAAVTLDPVIYIEGAPKRIPLGSTVVLQAAGSGFVKSSVRWKRLGFDGAVSSASLNEVTGELTVLGDGDGTVTVQCYATLPVRVESPVLEIQVKQGARRTETLKLDQKEILLGYSEESADSDSYTVHVTEWKAKDYNLLGENEITLSWKSSNEEVVTVSGNQESAVIRPVGVGTAKVTCTPLDGSGVKATITCKVEALVESFTIKGSTYVTKNKSYTYKAENFKPENCVSRNVIWTIADRPDWVSVGITSGVVKVAKTAPEGGTFTLVATAQDKGGASARLVITVAKAGADQLVISADRNEEYFKIKKNKNGSITSFSMFTKDVPADGDPTRILLTAAGRSKGVDMDYDASWTCNKADIVKLTPTASGDGVMVRALKAGTVTITCTLSDSSKKKQKITVTVREPVENITVGGQSGIMQGKSAKFKASEVLPKTAGMKKVVWSLSTNASGLSISSSGKVSAKGAAVGAKGTVIATAKDGSGVKGYMDFEVINEKTKSIVVSANASGLGFNKKTGSVISAQLYTVNIPRVGGDESQLLLTTKGSKTGLLWTSSDKSVATVTPTGDGTSALIQAKKSGNATITCKAQDGSSKKASVKLTITVPASNLSLLPQDSQDGDRHYLGFGNSVEIRAVAGSTYGKPGNTSVDWSYQIVNVEPVKNEAGEITGWNVTENKYSEDIKKLGVVSLKKGVLTLSKLKDFNGYQSMFTSTDRDYFCGVRVTAVTKDGTNLKASKVFIATPAVKSLVLYNLGTDTSVKNNINISVDTKKKHYVLRCKLDSNYGQGELKPVTGVKVSSSDPSVMSAYFDEEAGHLVVSALKEGKVKITIQAKDGSDTKLVINATVLP
ncbi:MAG: S8 family serine peptidase [Lachnospiraceae bacterium]|nr:S8 family serine peptidase [Lachnospiraceae bacterium]